MPDDILATKFHLPPLRPAYVTRPRLLKRLDEVPQRKLTLVTAPAGFGKTSLLREWLHHIEKTSLLRQWVHHSDIPSPVGWLSLDENDDNLPRFLRYLIHAFRQVNLSLGDEALALLNSGLPYASTVLTHLINDLADADANAPHIVILDDFHTLSDASIHDALDFFIANMPARVHLILASRTQPNLNLSRLRAQAQLRELHAADLRFTAVEVEQFFQQVMQLDLSAADRTALEMRTEGWVAGLQLAGLSLQAHADAPALITEFIAGFSGSDRFVADYLFDEVLQHQPEQEFLLVTSLLDHLHADLCDAVLNASDSASILERLDARQLFIIPLDNERRWYRYHHLFAELLRHHMQRTWPERIPHIYARASDWFEAQNRYEDAIRYASKGEDWERAAHLLELAMQEDDWLQSDMHHLLTSLEALPADILRARPGLELAYAWLLFEIFSGEWPRIEAHLDHVEMALNDASSDEARTMLASVDLLRANHARHMGQADRVIELCTQALQRLPQDDLYTRSGAMVHLAAGYESAGQLPQADQTYLQGMNMCRAGNNINGLMFAAARHIDLLHRMGQLRRAEAVFTRASDAIGGRTGPDVGMIYVTIGEVYREQNRLELAEDHLQRGVDLCSPFDAWKAGTIAGSISLARTLAAQNLFEEAEQLLNDLKASPHAAEHRLLDATAARLDLMQGRVHSAVRWSVTLEDDASEFENLTRARVLIAQAASLAEGVQIGDEANPLEQADHLLKRLPDSNPIEVRLLQVLTLVLALRQQTDAALHLLDDLLRESEPQGYVRTFADEGLLLVPLLRMLLAKPKPGQSQLRAYIETILDAASLPDETHPKTLPGNKLTAREILTLRLLATDSSTEEIAQTMSVSVSTVRTYAKRIYAKLGAHSRAEAVYLARELNLL